MLLCSAYHGNRVALGLGNWRPRAWKWAASVLQRQDKAAVPSEWQHHCRGLSGDLSSFHSPGTEYVPSNFHLRGCSPSWAYRKWRLTGPPCPRQGPTFSFYSGVCKLGSWVRSMGTVLGWIVSLSKLCLSSNPQIPQNETLFGDKVITDIIKL